MWRITAPNDKNLPMKEPVVMSWSGGKDSAMALHELLHSDVYEPISLLTTVSQEYRRISHHGVRESLLEEQAGAIGIPLRKVYLPSQNGGCTNEVYNSIMADVMIDYRGAGVRAVAFGDLFLEDLRAWRETNLALVGMRGIFPVWHRESKKFASDLIELGYGAIISCADHRLSQGFAGRYYDQQFLRDLPSDVDLCGENGEFHTFVYDGPIFDRPVRVRVGSIIERDRRHYADLVGETNALEECESEEFPPI
jgi:uncharacterized protein (TIGR00290 family)